MAYDKFSELRRIINQRKTMQNDNKNFDETIKSHAEEHENRASESGAEPDKAVLSDYDQLKTNYDTLLAEFNEQKDNFMRRTAEYDNSRKRLVKEKDEVVKFANEKLLQDFLPVLDSLEMTLSHAPSGESDPVVTGVGLVLKQFIQLLNKHGLEEIGNVGEAFDPNFHEAIASEPAEDIASGHITKIHRKGYKLKDRLIRPAMVSVSA